MKIPNIEPLQVAPQPIRLPAREARPEGGFEALQRGVEQVGQAGQAVTEAYLRERDQFAAKDAADGMTELTRHVTDANYGTTKTAEDNGPTPDVTKMSAEDFAKFLEGPPTEQTPGFLSTRGENALSALDGHLKSIDEKRKDISAKLKSARAKEVFDKASAGLVTETYRQAKGHVAQQLEVAKSDAVKASLAETIRAVSVDPSNDAWANHLVAQTAGAAAAMSTSEADAVNKIDAVRAEVAVARAAALIGADHYEEAKRVVDQSRHALGEKALPLDKAIQGGLAVQEAQTVAFDVVKGAVGEDGQVDQTKMLDGLSKVPAEKRKAVEPIAYRLMGEREQAYTADTKRISDGAFAVYNEKGWAELLKSEAVKPAAEQLNKRNPTLYNRLHDDWMNEVERAKRLKRGSSEDRRRQGELNDDAIKAFKALTVAEQRSIDVGQFLLGRETGGIYAKERNPVPDSLKALQQKAIDAHEKGLDVPMQNFINIYAGAANDIRPAQHGKAGDAARKAYDRQVRSDAIDIWEEARAAHPDRPPTQVELDKLTNLKLRTYAFDPKNKKAVKASNDALIRSTGGGGGQAKKLKGYLVSPDKTQRVPVYTDGTRGEPEAVR